VERVLPALQSQLDRDFTPVWGASAELVFVPKGKQPSNDAWWIGVFDNSRQALVLGYHNYTNGGYPLGKVFAGAAVHLRASWTSTLSHEILEMLVDPDTNLVALVETPGKEKYILAYEVCDPCQDDSYGYKVGSVLVSDFVYPAWFEMFHPKGSAQFDYRKEITEPLFVLPGGYIQRMRLGGKNRWYQVQARRVVRGHIPKSRLYARLDERRIPSHMKKPSEVAREKN